MDYFELTFKVHPKEPFSDILISELADRGFESFVEEDDGFKAYITTDGFAEEQLLLLPDFKEEAHYTYSKNLIVTKNWNEEWEKNFKPIDVGGKCWVRALFHPPQENTLFDIIIQPKMAFGTGHHATTYMMIEKMLDLDFQNKRIVDMGCGTGVLAILAAMKGAKEVMAIDIDAWACENTIENLQLNNIDHVSVHKGDVQIFAGKLFNTILANINRNVLLKDLEIYDQSLENQGDLLLSGFLKEDVPLIKAAAEKLNLKLKGELQKDNWQLLHFQK